MHVKLQLGASVVLFERKKRHFAISKGERGGRGHLVKDTSGFFVRLSGRSIGGHFWPLMESWLKLQLKATSLSLLSYVNYSSWLHSCDLVSDRFGLIELIEAHAGCLLEDEWTHMWNLKRVHDRKLVKHGSLCCCLKPAYLREPCAVPHHLCWSVEPRQGAVDVSSFLSSSFLTLSALPDRLCYPLWNTQSREAQTSGRGLQSLSTESVDTELMPLQSLPHGSVKAQSPRSGSA